VWSRHKQSPTATPTPNPGVFLPNNSVWSGVSMVSPAPLQRVDVLTHSAPGNRGPGIKTPAASDSATHRVGVPRHTTSGTREPGIKTPAVSAAISQRVDVSVSRHTASGCRAPDTKTFIPTSSSFPPAPQQSECESQIGPEPLTAVQLVVSPVVEIQQSAVDRSEVSSGSAVEQQSAVIEQSAVSQRLSGSRWLLVSQ